MVDGPRWFLPAAVLAVAACGGGDVDEKPIDPASRVQCALGPGSQFTQDCFVERSAEDGVATLTIHHPDGSFRRLELTADGAIAGADGADQPLVTQSGTDLDIAVAGDRYRIPQSAMDDGGK